MRAIAYLSHALAVRQAPVASSTLTPTPTPIHPQMVASTSPNNSSCSNTIGTPGSFYICSGPGNCEWWEYSKMTKDCRILDDAFRRPTLVGPDFGGHCHLYRNVSGVPACQDGQEVGLIAGNGVPLPVPGNVKKIVCPGIKAENIPAEGAYAIKCFDKVEHPSAMAAPGGQRLAAQSSVVGTPAVQTPSVPISPTRSPAANAPPPGCTPPVNTAKSGLAIRQNAPPTPDPCKCVTGNGHPGAFYICKGTNPATCAWHDVPSSTTCQSLDSIGYPGKDLTLLGPDFGGHCHLYTTATCDDNTEVWLGSTAESKKFVCPGKMLAPGMGLEKAVAIKCFDSVAHPTASPMVGAPAALTP